MRHLFLSAAMLGVCLAGFSATPDDYAHFAQSTVASHEDGHEHRWPCMARLSDGRILVVWSRLDLATNEDAIVGRVSQDGGCNWAGDRVFIQFDGQVDADPSMVVSGDRIFVTCTTVPPGGNIRISATWCVRSDDNGKTWSEPYEIPMGHRYTCGKTHHGLRLRSGTLVMGYSWDAICEQGTTLTSEGDMDLRAGVLRSSDNGDTWTNGGDTDAEYEKVSGGAVSGTDEPALVELEDGSLYTLVRTGSAYLYEGRSDDEGQTWHSIQASGLHGSNAPAALNAFDIGERRGIFAVWDNALSRSPLCAAASFDGGRTWSRPKDIGFPYTGGQASYPSCEQAPDGALLAVWQHDVPGGRDIRMARFSLAWLLADENAHLTETLGSVRLPENTSTPDGPAFQAPVEEWQRHRDGGTLTADGTLHMPPMAGCYMDDRPALWEGSRGKLVTVRMRILDRERTADGNHSAAELWIGGPEPGTSALLLFREDAVAFDASYDPAFAIDAASYHTYRVLTDHARGAAYLFVDDGDTPVLATRLGAPYGYNLNRILFGDSGSAKDVSGSSEWASVRWSDAALPEIPKTEKVSVKIVTFGDSTTAPRGPLRIYTDLLREDLPVRGFDAVVVNAGVGGNSTAMARDRFERDVLALKPDIVTISFGINDSAIDIWKDVTEPRVTLEAYAANLRYFIATLRERGAQPILMTPNPLAWTGPNRELYGKPPYDVNDPKGFDAMLRPYVEKVREIAQTEAVPLADVHQAFSEYAREHPIEELLLDGVHPNDLGHRLIADLLLDLIPAMANTKP